MNIFVSMPIGLVRDTFFNEAAKKRLEQLGAVFLDSPKHLTVDELKEVLKTTEVLITGWGHATVTCDMLAGSPLKMLVHTGGTVGSLVEAAAYDEFPDLKILSGNGYFAESVAEGIIAYMMFGLRRLDKQAVVVANDMWGNFDATYTDGLLDQTVGIVSLGAISRKVIEMAQPFRVAFKVYSTSLNEHNDGGFSKKYGFCYTTLEDIFSTCKVVSVHTAGKPETRHLIDQRLLSMLRKDALFINTSRGIVVDEEALIQMVKEKRFRAILDVYQKEPIDSTYPLAREENATVFAHVAGPTIDRRVYIAHGLIDDIECYIAGKEMKNVITKSMAAKMTVGG